MLRREVPEDCGTASGHSPPLPHSPHLPVPRHAPAAGYVCPLGPQDEQRQNCGWMPCPGENGDPAGQLWSGPGSREQSLQEYRGIREGGGTCRGFLGTDGLLASGQSKGWGQGVTVPRPLTAGRLQEPGKEWQGWALDNSSSVAPGCGPASQDPHTADSTQLLLLAPDKQTCSSGSQQRRH